MQVSLGTISIDEDTRKALRKHLGAGGLASREDVKNFALNAVNDAIKNIVDPPETVVQPEVAQVVEMPVTAPPAADELPEPPSAGTTTVYTGTGYTGPAV